MTERWFGRSGQYREQRAAVIVKDTDAVYVVRGSTARNGAPSFRDQVTGDGYASFYRQSRRALPLTNDVVRLVGYIVLPDSTEAWSGRLNESFTFLKDHEVLASQTVNI